MINITDYKSYFHQNFNLMELLRENNSLVYDRLTDVLKVLGFIEMMVDEDKEIEEDFEVIFEVGFSYFHEQFELIKLYFNNYFKRNFHKFLEYETLINYSLYLDDLEEVLKEKSLMTDETKKEINNIGQELEKTLLDKLDFDRSLIEQFNERLDSLVPVGTYTTLEIYGMIVEELSI